MNPNFGRFGHYDGDTAELKRSSTPTFGYKKSEGHFCKSCKDNGFFHWIESYYEDTTCPYCVDRKTKEIVSWVDRQIKLNGPLGKPAAVLLLLGVPSAEVSKRVGRCKQLTLRMANEAVNNVNFTNPKGFGTVQRVCSARPYATKVIEKLMKNNNK